MPDPTVSGSVASQDNLVSEPASQVSGGKVGMGQSGDSRPTPRPWYRPAVMWEWQRPWWGFKRMDEMMPELNLLPVRALFIGPITLTWLGPMKGAKS